MKLRIRTNLKLILGGLAASAVTMPFAVAFLVWLAVASQVSEQPQLRRRFVIGEIAKVVYQDSSGHFGVKKGYVPPKGLSLVLASTQGSVLYSTSGEFAVGDEVDLARVTAAIQGEAEGSSFFAETVEFKGETLGTYYAWLSRNSEAMVGVPRPSSIHISLIVLSFVAVVFILGAFVATKLAQAVFRLEGAARRIAAGDLGTSVECGEGIQEIDDLAEAMDSMRAALREDRDRRARFLAAVSHDLRTPLTSIAGYLEAVSDGLAGDPSTLERYVGIMRGKTRILEDRIAGLIEFARMGTDEWRMGFEAIELEPFLDEVCRVFSEDAALMGRTFSWDVEVLSGLLVNADRTLLTRALENLLSNAIRYSPVGSPVRLSAERARAGHEDLRYLVHVDDEGPGVSLAERDRVFEPFTRGSSAREGEGIGMGLYIVASVIKGHGWEIYAETSPAGGGRFTISIPGQTILR